jgi:hypothetical protein
MIKLVEVKALPNYKLWLRYADGVAGTLDLADLVGQGVFALWNDPVEFQKAHMGPGGEIAWTDEVDICADAAYLDLTGKKPEDIFPALRDCAHA